MMQKLRERLGLSFHGPNVNGCTEYLRVRDGGDLTPTALRVLGEDVRLADKFGVVFSTSDFKKGDIVRLKKNKNILILSDAASTVHELLFKLDHCCRARDELLVAADGDKMLVHNNGVSGLTKQAVLA
jgi:hypothetical protein